MNGHGSASRPALAALLLTGIIAGWAGTKAG
jgi:hypothetical protein